MFFKKKEHTNNLEIYLTLSSKFNYLFLEILLKN